MAMTLGDICKVDWGNTALTKKSYVDDGKYLAVSATGGDGRLNHYEHEADVCVLSAIGAQCGKMFFPQQRFTAIKNTITLTPNADTVFSKFLYYLFTAIELPKRGAAQPFISKGDIENFKIPYLPPLTEQQRIVAKLDAAFAEIDDERERVFLRLKNAQSLFSNILETEFSQISNNYSCAELGEVCAKIQDGAHQSPKQLFDEQADNQFPYITAKNIRTNWMKLDKIQYVNEDFHNAIYKNCDVKFGDVLLTKDGASTGNICLNEIDEPISLLSSVCLIRGEESVLSNQYVCFYLQSPTGFSAVTGSMTGAAIKRIILKRIKQTQIPLAPLHEQHKLNEKLLSVLNLISEYQNSLEKIADNYTSLKSAILAKELQSEAA